MIFSQNLVYPKGNKMSNTDCNKCQVNLLYFIKYLYNL